jgi:hypothetical protein
MPSTMVTRPFASTGTFMKKLMLAGCPADRIRDDGHHGSRQIVVHQPFVRKMLGASLMVLAAL